MFEELDNGQYGDWVQYHRQYNLEFDKPDVFSAMAIADFRNVNKSDGASDVRPIDVMPWRDPHGGDDDEFLGSIRAFAAVVQPQQVNGAS